MNYLFSYHTTVVKSLSQGKLTILSLVDLQSLCCCLSKLVSIITIYSGILSFVFCLWALRLVLYPRLQDYLNPVVKKVITPSPHIELIGIKFNREDFW